MPFTPPPAKIALHIRRLEAEDDLSFLDDEPELSAKDAQLRADQRWLLSSNLPTCWVAVDPAGKICFMTWMLTSQDNALIRELWGDWLPKIKPDEVLIEGIYTAESHRGLGIMADAATRIAEGALATGARYGLGFIGSGNSPSLRAGEKAGWIPFLTREEGWVLFRRRVRFSPVVDAHGTE
ncbi:MAG: hypothetical protein WBB07_12685 [Mycobacterium sp.]